MTRLERSLLSVCKDEGLTEEMLVAALAPLPDDELVATKAEHGATPLHWLCGNKGLTEELLAAALAPLPDDVLVATKGEDGATPLRWLCGNEGLTEELLAAALAPLPDDVLVATKGEDGATPLRWLCGNEGLTEELLAAASLWSVDGADPLLLAIKTHAAGKATRLQEMLVKSSGKGAHHFEMQYDEWSRTAQRWGKEGHHLQNGQECDDNSEGAKPHLQGADKTEFRPADLGAQMHEAVNMVACIAALFDIGVGRQAVELLRDHGVVDARYKVGADEHGNSYGRVSLADAGLVAVGRKDFVPRVKREDGKQDVLTSCCAHKGTRKSALVDHGAGIEWSGHGHLRFWQYRNSPNRVEVKPVVTQIHGAGHAGHEGLLHVLLRPGVPVAVFDTKIAKALVEHKWKEFGFKTFRSHAVAFFLMVCAFVVTTWTVTRHGGAALDPAVGAWEGWGGVVLAAASGTGLSWAADVCLPLSPRSTASVHLKEGRRGGQPAASCSCVARVVLGRIGWYATRGWFTDGNDDSRTRWSPLGYTVRQLPTVGPLGSHALSCRPSAYGALKLPTGEKLFVFLVLLPMYYFVILPTYYTAALTAHFGPPLAAAVLLGYGQQPDDGFFALDSVPSVTATAITALVAMTARLVVLELREFYGLRHRLRHRDVSISRYIQDMWNKLDVATLSLNVTVVACTLARAEPVTISQLAVINTGLLVLRSLQLLSGFDATAKYVSMFFEVTKDMTSFLMMIGETPSNMLTSCRYVGF
jgi:hypothetical protein